MAVPATKITILISGRGTNLQAILDACQNGTIQNASVVRVISNRKEAEGLLKARKSDVATSCVSLPKYKKQHPATPEGEQEARETFFQDLAVLLLQDQPSIVVLAGFMLVVTASFLEQLAAASVPIINLHPALPGAFNGIDAIRRAHEALNQGKITKTGVMVHYVIKEVDEGAPILVRELPIIEGESLDDFEVRLHDLEHETIVEGTSMAIDRLLASRVRAAEWKHVDMD